MSDFNLEDALLGMETTKAASRDKKIMRAAFGWPGGKSRSYKKIIELLPYTDRYVEVFGGCGIVMLAREPVEMEVFNDRHSGITAFYRCLKDPKLFQQLCDWVDLTICSREEWAFCKETWQDINDPLERACRWYYMLRYSFGHLGRNFGRSTSSKSIIAGKIRRRLDWFPTIHERLRKVQIENQDWRDIIADYDHSQTVFYLDPPYIDAHAGTYQYGMSHDDHRELIDIIFESKGFFALSGYPNNFYDSRNWDAVHSWPVYVSMEPIAFTEENRKADIENLTKRGKVEEHLWIKEARS